jgi:hypothetical protein
LRLVVGYRNSAPEKNRHAYRKNGDAHDDCDQCHLSAAESARVWLLRIHDFIGEIPRLDPGDKSTVPWRLHTGAGGFDVRQSIGIAALPLELAGRIESVLRFVGTRDVSCVILDLAFGIPEAGCEPVENLLRGVEILFCDGWPSRLDQDLTLRSTERIGIAAVGRRDIGVWRNGSAIPHETDSTHTTHCTQELRRNPSALLAAPLEMPCRGCAYDVN